MRGHFKDKVIIPAVFAAIFLFPSGALAYDWQQSNTTGFQAGLDNNYVNNYATYASKLYATTFNEPDGCGGGSIVDDGNQIWRSTDGASWTRITDTDLRCLTDNSLLITFGSNLYLGTQVLIGAGPETVRIYRSATGDSDTWTQVNTTNFGHADSGQVMDMIVFGSELYAVMAWPGEARELWKTADGTTWTEVDTSEVANFDGSTFAIFGGQLYSAGGFGGAIGTVFRSSDGSTWSLAEDFAEMIGSDFDNVNKLEVFGSNLYAYLSMFEGGVRVYRSSSGNDGTWTQVNTNGFGDTENGWLTPFAYKRMRTIGDTLYIGTLNFNGAELWKTTDGTTWVNEFEGGLGNAESHDLTALISFNDRIYVGLGTNAQVWRTRPPQNWDQVVGDGNGTTSQYSPQVMTVFNDQIYLGEFTFGCEGARLFRSVDGSTWTQITDADFPADLCEIDDFAEFNGFFYFITSEDTPSQVKIFRSDTGASDDWELVNTVADTFRSLSLEMFGSALYAGIGNDVWRTTDGTTWSDVATLTEGDSLAMAVHGSNLFIGGVGATPNALIWRSSNGTTWTLVEDFGTNSNEVRTLVTFDGYFYAMTYPVSEGYGIWRSADGDIWTQVNEDGFGDPNNSWTSAFPLRSAIVGDVLMFGIENTVTGGELWGSPNGTTWTQIGDDGFGYLENDGFISITVFGDRIYLGARNATTGYQIWRSPVITPLIYLASDGGALTTPGEDSTDPGAQSIDAQAITTRSLPMARVGQSYSVQLVAHWGTAPYTFSLASGTLPAGLTLTSTGLLSGTPTSVVNSSFTVQVTDSEALSLTSEVRVSDTGSQPFSLNVLPETGTSANALNFLPVLLLTLTGRRLKIRT